VSPSLPPLAAVLKSRDVEDPVNLWVHRPLAYAFVAAIYRTSISPDQITWLAMLVGLVASGCFLGGTPDLMLAGGILLWASAILDGADGILARAKQQFSTYGRALDGTADAVVGACSVGAAFTHLWMQTHDVVQLAAMPIALVTAVLQIYLYDYYKEAFLQMTNPHWNGIPDQSSDIEPRIAKLREEGAGWAAILSMNIYRDLLRTQASIVRKTNPWGSREDLRFRVTEESAQTYRRLHRGPMRIWAMVSLAPHTYVMSICAMFDRLDVYLWLRLFLANALWAIVLVWQRSASRRSAEALEKLGLAPQPA